LLAEDTRLTGEELGERVSLSESAAHWRVKALEASGAILGCRARLSDAARRTPSTVFAHVTQTDQRQATMQAFEEELAQTPVADEAYLMRGEPDQLLKVLVHSDESYERIDRGITFRPARSEAPGDAVYPWPAQRRGPAHVAQLCGRCGQGGRRCPAGKSRFRPAMLGKPGARARW
jgi:DNA-binding Lrp family transcriptional regulator